MFQFLSLVEGIAALKDDPAAVVHVLVPTGALHITPDNPRVDFKANRMSLFQDIGECAEQGRGCMPGCGIVEPLTIIPMTMAVWKRIAKRDGLPETISLEELAKHAEVARGGGRLLACEHWGYQMAPCRLIVPEDEGVRMDLILDENCVLPLTDFETVRAIHNWKVAHPEASDKEVVWRFASNTNRLSGVAVVDPEKDPEFFADGQLLPLEERKSRFLAKRKGKVGYILLLSRLPEADVELHWAYLQSGKGFKGADIASLHKALHGKKIKGYSGGDIPVWQERFAMIAPSEQEAWLKANPKPSKCHVDRCPQYLKVRAEILNGETATKKDKSLKDLKQMLEAAGDCPRAQAILDWLSGALAVEDVYAQLKG